MKEKMGNFTESEFILEVIDASIHAGIATAKPTKDNLAKASLKAEQLKRGCGCFVEDEEQYKKKMPMTHQMQQEGTPKHAEIVRGALREIATCCLEGWK